MSCSTCASLSGLQDASLRMAAASHNIAVMNVTPPTRINEVSSAALPNGQGVRTVVTSRESVFGVDLTSELVNLKLGSLSFQANAKALQVSQESFGTLIDMFDTD